MSMTSEEKKLIDLLKNGTPKFKAAASKIFKNFTGGASFGVGQSVFGGVGDSDEEFANMMKTRQRLMQSFGESSIEAANAMRGLETESYNLFQTTENGLRATEALTTNLRTFAFMTKDVQKELGTTTMILEKFGVNMEDTGQILDTAAMAFGFSQEQLKGLANELATVVYKFPGQASDIARNFKSAQSSLAYDSGKMMQVFKKLQNVSSTTGVGFDKLTTAFGDSMDTFEGSATKAGSLNAILGRSVFNSIDLLGKTEAQRVDTIVKGVRSSIGGDVNRLGKFQLKAVAEGMGLTVEETRRLLTGQSSVDDVLKQKDASDPKTKLQQQSNKAMGALTMGLDALKTEMKLFRTPLENLAIQQSAVMREEIMQKTEKIMQKYGGTPIGSTSEAVERLQGFLSGIRDMDPASREAFIKRRAQMAGTVSEEDAATTFRQEVIGDITRLRDAGVKLPRTLLEKVFPSETGGGGGGSGGGGNDPNNDGGGGSSDTEPSWWTDFKGFFTDGKMKLEVTGLDGTTLKGLLKNVPTP